MHDINNLIKRTLKKTALSLGYVIKRAGSHSSGSDFVEDLGKILGQDTSPTIFDVGANVGQTAIRFRAEFPYSRIYSFEPCSGTYAQLKDRLNGDSLTYCVNVALGGKEGQAELYKYGSSELNSLKQQHSNVGALQTEVVRVQTLYSFCAANGVTTIDVLKSDTEGYDLEVLRGGESLLRDGRIKAIVIEATFDSSDLVHSNFFRISELLFDCGFLLVSLYDTTYMPGSGRIIHFNVMFVHKSLRATLSKLELAR